MTPPIGPLVGAAVLLTVAGLALRRPILALLGLSRATERPRRLLLVAIGLMVATAVTAGASITADSIGASEGQAALDQVGATDVILTTRSGHGLSQDHVDALLQHDQVAGLVNAYAPAWRSSASVADDRTDLGEPAISLWGVQAEQARLLGLIDPIEGEAPQAPWPSDAIMVNQALASRLDARLGDPLTLYVHEPTEPTTRWDNRSGVLVAAAEGADGYVHAPQDEYTFDLEVPRGSLALALAAEPGTASVDLDLEVQTPGGQVVLVENGSNVEPDQPRIRIDGQALEPGTWTVRVHAKQAANTSFRLAVGLDTADAPTERGRAIEGRLVGVVDDAGSDPIEPGPAAYLAREHLLGTIGRAAGEANVVLVQAISVDQAPVLAKGLAQAVDELGGQGGGSDRLPVRVEDVRTQALERAEQGAPWLRMFFLTLGSFSILAGFLLIVSLMGMLVEERKPELATLRATGAQRSHLTQLHLHEGAVYGLVAGALGLVLGIGLAWFIVDTASTFSFYEGVDIELVLELGTLASSFGVGLALTVAAVGLAAHRAGCFNIARALHGEQDPPGGLTWRGWVGYGVLVLAGVAGSLAALLTGSALATVLAPPVLALGLGGLLVRRFARSVVYPIMGILVFAYVAATFIFLTDVGSDAEFLLIPVRGLLITVAGSLVLVWMDWPAQAASWLVSRLPGLEPVADPAFSYPTQRRTRTGLTVAMIALVVLVLVMTSTVYAMFGPNLRQEAGGFDVVATAREPIENPRVWLEENPTEDGSDPLSGAEQVVAVPRVAGGGQGALVNGSYMFTAGPVFDQRDVLGVTPELAQASRFDAKALGDGYDSMDGALSAVSMDPGLVVLSDWFRVEDPREGSRELEPGDRVSLRRSDGWVNLTVAATQEGGVFGGVLVHPDVVRSLGQSVTTRLFITASPDVDARELARQVEAGFRSAGMDAVSVLEIQAEANEDVRSQLAVLQVFLGTGLVVGIAAIGIVTARNVLERRGEIGVMRAVGAQRGHVEAVFTIETLFVVVLGIAIGLSGGILAAYGAFLTSFEQSGAVFSIDWLNILIVIVVALSAGLVAALIPARRAGGLAPAHATRYVD